MNPDKSNPNGGDRDLQAQPQADLSSHGALAGTSPATTKPTKTPQAAAADVIRSQIGNLYNTTQEAEAVTTTSDDDNLYHREHAAHPLPEAEQWKQYHTAWQNYYQKYYENYYTAQATAIPVVETTPTPKETATQHEGYFTQQPTEPAHIDTPEELSNDRALLELRRQLLGRVTSAAKKVRKSRHFVPIISALAVVFIFVFIQYNQVITANVMAYVSPGSINPQNIVVDPTTDVTVSQESRLIIPKINIDVPVYYDVGSDYDSQMAAMAKGVAHFPIPGANSHPGEVGNTVIAGHSSNDVFGGGDYKFIFVQLEKLSTGDTIYANYNGKRYTYVVTKTATVEPTDVQALIYPTTKPVMTLITCTPIGTALHRFLVTAEQVSPDPAAATTAPTDPTATAATTSIPGDSGSLFQKLFGGGN